MQDQFDSVDLSDNEIRKLECMALLPRLKMLLLSNNRISRCNHTAQSLCARASSSRNRGPRDAALGACTTPKRLRWHPFYPPCPFSVTPHPAAAPQFLRTVPQDI